MNAEQVALAHAAGIHFDFIGGNCPVQAEGSFDGLRFYFRARGQHWQFHVALHDYDIMENDLVRVVRPYVPTDGGSPQFAAGWMPVAEAVAFIIAEVAAFRTWAAEKLETA